MPFKKMFCPMMVRAESVIYNALFFVFFGIDVQILLIIHFLCKTTNTCVNYIILLTAWTLFYKI